jgi:hypothetical protein
MKQLLEAFDRSGSMQAAVKHPSGPKFVGKMKGTDPASARYSKYVGSCEESEDHEENLLKELDQEVKDHGVEWRLREAYKKFSEDMVPTQGATQGSGGAVDPVAQKAAQTKIKSASNTFQRLATQAGIKPIGGMSASQSATAAVQGLPPNANTATGSGVPPMDKKVIGALGSGIQQALANASPADANKFITDLTAMKQKGLQGKV